jgi:two-component system phosphate regulon response regulator OmpR
MPFAARVQDVDRKVHHKEVAMKAAPHYKQHCLSVASSDSASHKRAPLHAPRRRSSVAGGLRQMLTEQLDHQRRSGQSIRSIEQFPLDIIELGHAPLAGAVPRVLLVDPDSTTALILATLLMPEAQVVHVPTLAAAQQALRGEIFSAVVLDPSLPDGDAASLMPALYATPLLVYSAREPAWRGAPGNFLPKPWTSPRQLWAAISTLLGKPPAVIAGD